MTTLKKILLLAFIGALFVTCKKEELPQNGPVGQPVFSFTGTIGANVLNLQAGVNNYYMYSSYTQDSGVYNFTGTLQSTSSVKNSIQITINDDAVVGQGSPSDISNSVAPNMYYYSIPGGNPISDVVTFTPKIYAGTPTEFFYQFGDGGFIYEQDTRSVPHTYKKLEPVTITSLSVSFTNQTKAVTVINPINLMKQSNPLNVDSIHCSLNVDSGSSKTVTLTAYITGGVVPYSYVWYFGDGKADTNIGTSSSPTVSITHTYAIDSIKHYPDTLTFGVKDASNTLAIHRILVEDTVPYLSQMNYYISPPSPVPNPHYLSNVTITYIDGTGLVFTSNSSLQPAISTFQVTSVSDYQNNANNNKTKMLKVTFNCMLYNGNSAIPASGSAVIAVAYQ